MRRTILTSMVCVGVVSVLAGAAGAGVVYQQGPADTHVAFEAEGFDSLVRHHTSPDRGWVVVDAMPTFTTGFGSPVLPAGTNASGGAAIVDDVRVGNMDHSSTLTYRIIFSQPGSYRFYYRYSLFEDNSNTANYGNEDSFYFSPSFGADATLQDGTADRGDGQPGNDPINHPHEGLTYFWRNSGDSLTVAAGDVGKALEFKIDDRESGWSLDRLIFSTNDALGAAALSTLPNTALVPSPMALPGGLMLLELAMMRRR